MGFHTSMIACGSSVLICAVGTWMNKVFCATFSYPAFSVSEGCEAPGRSLSGTSFRGSFYRGWAASSSPSSGLPRSLCFAIVKGEGVEGFVVIYGVVIVSATNLVCLVILRVKSVTAGPASEDVSARTTI